MASTSNLIENTYLAYRRAWNCLRGWRRRRRSDEFARQEALLRRLPGSGVYDGAEWPGRWPK